MTLSTYRPDIDGLRAVAVAAVVLFHCNLAFSGGFVGVDVFYVISGYLIVGLIGADIAKGTFTYRGFYERRIRRLYPAMFLVLAVTSLWAVTQMLWVDLQAYARSLMATVFYLSNIQFYSESGYFTEEATIKPLLHTWSLAVEEQFYLLVPALMVVLHRRFGTGWRVAVLALLVALSFILCLVVIGRDRAAAFYMLPTRAWELGTGGLLAMTGLAWVARRRWLAEALGVGGLLAIGYAVVRFDGNVPFPDARAALPVIGAAMVIAGGSVPQTVVARLLSLPPAAYLGRISYPLYLWHWPLIVMVVYGRHDPLGRQEAYGVVAASLVLSALTLHLVERPIRARQWLPRPAGLFRGAVVASGLALGVAAVLLVSQGFPGRHDPALVALVQEQHLLDKEFWNHDQRQCHQVSPRNLANGKACIRGATGAEPVFALVGDSHADAASPGIFAAAEQLGVAGWQLTMPGLILTPGRHPMGTRSEGGIPEVLGFLDQNPEVRIIVITGWWARAITGKSYRDSPTIFVDEEYRGTGLADNPRSFSAALERLAARYPDRLIVLLDDVPFGRRLDMKGFVRAYAVTGVRPEPGIPRGEATGQRRIYVPALEDVDARFANVIFRPVFNSLCDQDFCPLFTPSGQPIFRDGDHLSRVGATMLDDSMTAILDEALRLMPPAAP
jgi:peptidoglycan/LPS O-acetylase OafA/YrhL/GNAT superfamily N-acetyltransferase